MNPMRAPLILAILFAASLLPSAAYAATLSLVPGAAGADQEFPIQIRIAPEGEHLNVVEGTIRIPNGVTVTRVSTGGSSLTLWTVQPVFSRATHEVSFTGGVPGGLPADGTSLLITVYARASAGTYAITPTTVTGFRADGSGTRVPVTVSPITVTVGSATVKDTTPADHQAPDQLIAELGSDASIFGGLPYVFAYGHDAGTGIASFETKEGWFGSFAPSDRYYVLKHSPAYTPVWVRAIDVAGNARTVHVPGTGGLVFIAVCAAPFVLLILLLIALFIWKKRRPHR
jgi:hypothetical protein